MAVRLMHRAQRKQRLDALATRFTDADQQPRRHRDAQFTGSAQSVESPRRYLIGGTEVRTIPAA